MDKGNAEQASRARHIPGSGRSAALQILAIATAITVVCALQPIPIQGPPHRGGLFSVALRRPTAWREIPGSAPKRSGYGCPVPCRDWDDNESKRLRKRLLVGENPKMQTLEYRCSGATCRVYAKKKGAEAPWGRWQGAALGALPL